MGKRSDFPRRARDFYITPYEAVIPLLPHLEPETKFWEPCAGDGALVDHLEQHSNYCFCATDIVPQGSVENEDVFNIRPDWVDGYASHFITNPPWDRKILHPLIIHLSDILPTWLLFDADWMHTKQATPYLERCVKIVSVGRVKWIPDSKMTGKDNCAWYLFDVKKVLYSSPIQFFGRSA